MNLVIAPLVLFSALILSVGCSTPAAQSRLEKAVPDETPMISESSPSPGPVTTSIKDSTGLIVLSDKYSKDDTIRIYNADGSLWYEFSFYYENQGGKFNERSDFAPFAFHPDYFTLALRCVGEEKNRYEVVVNDESGLRKFVKKGDKVLRFQTWEYHVTEAFAVQFENKTNPIRVTPDGNQQDLNLPEDVTFHPVKINGEWLQVRWESEGSAKSGWIKWKGNEQLLVELFYFA
jgi:hypothetical protein